MSNLATAVLNALDKTKRPVLVACFNELHQQLAVESGVIAASAIAELVGSGGHS